MGQLRKIVLTATLLATANYAFAKDKYDFSLPQSTTPPIPAQPSSFSWEQRESMNTSPSAKLPYNNGFSFQGKFNIPIYKSSNERNKISFRADTIINHSSQPSNGSYLGFRYKRKFKLPGQ